MSKPQLKALGRDELRINPSREFRSKVTRRNCISRIEATCLTPNLIYLITCKVGGKQGVGSIEYLPARVSNYYSHIKKKKRTNKISIHFQEFDNQNHTAEDMDIQIVNHTKRPKRTHIEIKEGRKILASSFKNSRRKWIKFSR